MEPEISLPHSPDSVTCPSSPIQSIPPSHFLKIHFIFIMLSSAPRSSKWFPSLRFSNQNPVCTSPCPIRAKCSDHLIFIEIIPCCHDIRRWWHRDWQFVRCLYAGRRLFETYDFFPPSIRNGYPCSGSHVFISVQVPVTVGQLLCSQVTTLSTVPAVYEARGSYGNIASHAVCYVFMLHFTTLTMACAM